MRCCPALRAAPLPRKSWKDEIGPRWTRSGNAPRIASGPSRRHERGSVLALRCSEKPSWCFSTNRRQRSTQLDAATCADHSPACVTRQPAVFLNSHLLSEVEQVCDRSGGRSRSGDRAGTLDELCHGTRKRASSGLTQADKEQPVALSPPRRRGEYLSLPTSTKPRTRAGRLHREWVDACTKLRRPSDTGGPIPPAAPRGGVMPPAWSSRASRPGSIATPLILDSCSHPDVAAFRVGLSQI